MLNNDQPMTGCLIVAKILLRLGLSDGAKDCRPHPLAGEHLLLKEKGNGCKFLAGSEAAACS
jgi:hypothetical protein